MLGLLEIFYSPGKVFDRVRERGTWWPPLVAMFLVGILAGYMTQNMVSMSSIVRKQLESDPRTAERLGPDGIERVANMPMYKYLGYVGAVSTPIICLIMAGIFMGGLSITGGRVRFGQVLGATAYSWWPYYLVVTAMAALVIFLSKDREDLNYKNLLAVNAGAFLDPATTSKPLYSFASSIDLLSFFLLFLLSYGLSKVSNQKMGTCAGIVFAVWAIYVVLKVGTAMIF